MFLKIGALASVLGIPAEDVLDSEQTDDQQSAMILSGYAIGGMRNVVKRSDIAHIQSRVDEQRAKMASIVERTETDRREIAEHGKKTTDELDRLHEAQQSQWNEFHTAADKEWQSLRRAYEEHPRLEAPATYWIGEVLNALSGDGFLCIVIPVLCDALEVETRAVQPWRGADKPVPSGVVPRDADGYVSQWVVHRCSKAQMAVMVGSVW